MLGHFFAKLTANLVLVAAIVDVTNAAAVQQNQQQCATSSLRTDPLYQSMVNKANCDYAKSYCTSILRPVKTVHRTITDTCTKHLIKYGATSTIHDIVNKVQTVTAVKTVTVPVEVVVTTVVSTETALSTTATSLFTKTISTAFETSTVSGTKTTIVESDILSTVSTKTDTSTVSTVYSVLTTSAFKTDTTSTSTYLTTTSTETSFTAVETDISTVYTSTEVDHTTISTETDYTTISTETDISTTSTALEASTTSTLTDVSTTNTATILVPTATSIVSDTTTTATQIETISTETVTSYTATITTTETVSTEYVTSTVTTTLTTLTTGTVNVLATVGTTTVFVTTATNTVYAATTTTFQEAYKKRGPGVSHCQRGHPAGPCWMDVYGAAKVNHHCSCIVQSSLPTLTVQGPPIVIHKTVTQILWKTLTVHVPSTRYLTQTDYKLITSTAPLTSTKRVTAKTTGGVTHSSEVDVVATSITGTTIYSTKTSISNSIIDVIATSTEYVTATSTIIVTATETVYTYASTEQGVVATTTLSETLSSTVYDVSTTTEIDTATTTLEVVATTISGIVYTTVLGTYVETTQDVTYTTTVYQNAITTIYTTAVLEVDVTATSTTEVAVTSTSSVTATSTSNVAGTTTGTLTSTASCSATPIINGGFESGVLSPWTVPSDSTFSVSIGSSGAYAGTYDVYGGPLTSTSQYFAIRQSVNFCPYTTYACSLAYKSKYSSSENSCSVYYGSTLVTTFSATSSTWRKSATFNILSTGSNTFTIRCTGNYFYAVGLGRADEYTYLDDITCQVGGERDVVSRFVPVEKDLGTDGVSGGPEDKVHGYGDGLLRLATYVSGYEGHGEEEAGFGGGVFVHDRHQDDGADEGGHDVTAHGQHVLAGFLDDPRRTQEDEDYEGAEDHGEELGLKHGEVEARDDYVGEGPEAGSRECGAELDAPVTPALRVQKSFFELFWSEPFVLESRLVRANAFNHQVLVFFGETLGSHGTVRHPEEDKYAPENREAAVCDEDGLPRFERSRVD
ncbi:hypothetical protein UCRPC4_g04298 [Phaeomoniella chlamydospora]|uniref:CBM-cenC domain-containing protein n=1 Tax=Phaeomoniella chlamydospora TaxID=158046 RepID=A0A0G2GT66_PHACM|nr:hypothetical protein UCRPC4_g04298 [Phaeomoniella chlamydospora]